MKIQKEMNPQLLEQKIEKAARKFMK